MAMEPVERLNYYQFQYVGAEDFRAQQAYHRDMRRRHNLGPHSWGVVTGATIVETAREGDAPFVDVSVLPGVIVDGFGREIVILEPVRIDPELFAAFATDRHLELWVRYDELATHTATGGFAPCTDAESFGRLRESYRFAVGTIEPWRDELFVGGDVAHAIATPQPPGPIEPADASVPYQDFPDSERGALWLVRLGSVHWDGTVRKFRPVASPDRLSEGRVYAGLTGASLLSEAPGLRIAPRVAHVDRDDADFAGVEGRLRVDGRVVAKRDVFLHGGLLSFQATGGTDETRPLWIKRLAPPAGSGADLRIHIGDTAQASTRLTIGPGPVPTAIGTEQVVLAVRGDDKVDVPTGRLRLQGAPRQLLDLSVEDDLKIGGNGIGRHAGATYWRSTGGHYWYRGGEHRDADGDPGTGGVELMRLSAQGALYFIAPYRQLINADVNGQGFGLGVQDNTLYQRSNLYFAWYRGGGHGSGALDSGGGAMVMHLDGQSRLTVQGGVTSRGDVRIEGSALEFLMAGGGHDTDRMRIDRVNNGVDRNDLRLVIGDNTTGDDRLVVGPISAADGAFKEQFVVENDGDVRVAGDLYVGGRKALTDIMTGEYWLNRTSDGSGTVPLTITSRLPRVTSAAIMVALIDIGNTSTAIDARWRVTAPSAGTIVAPNQATFNVSWTVGDTDGRLTAFSYLVIFQA